MSGEVAEAATTNDRSSGKATDLDWSEQLELFVMLGIVGLIVVGFIVKTLAAFLGPLLKGRTFENSYIVRLGRMILPIGRKDRAPTCDPGPIKKNKRK